MDNRLMHAMAQPVRNDKHVSGRWKIFDIRIDDVRLAFVPDHRFCEVVINVFRNFRLYVTASRLDEGERMQTWVDVDGELVYVSIEVHVWQVIQGGLAAGAAAQSTTAQLE